MIGAALAGLAAALGVAGMVLAIGGGAGGGGEARLRRLLGIAGARVRAAPPGDLEARVAAAGRPAGLGTRELMAAKLGGAGVGSAIGIGVASASPGRAGVLVLGAAPVAGFLAPDLWLSRRAARRAEAIRRGLPAMLELLRVTVEAGSPLAEALARVGERTHGPLAAEWRAVGREVALGVPLQGALAAMARRAPLPEVQALIAALDRARRHGAPLADTLSAQARDARFARTTHAREQAARAGPKIQLVVALLLVPSVLLLVAAALLAALMAPGEPGGGLLPV